MEHHSTAILHYSAPPVVGGVESVIQAHAQVFLQAGYSVTVIAGRGEQAALPVGTGLVQIPEMGTQHPQIVPLSAQLDRGELPTGFDDMTQKLVGMLAPTLSRFDNLIVHNVFTKHFNLPLTAALCRLLDGGQIRHCIAWCHDFTWTSPRSRSKVHPGHPWDLLRGFRETEHAMRSGERVVVTASVGAAVYALGSPFKSPSELVQAADQALYRAKTEGRDRYVFHAI